MFKRVMRIVAVLFIMTVIPGGITAFAWDGTLSGTNDGSTKEKAVLIESIEDLKMLADKVNSGEKYTFSYFKLTKDLDFSGYTYADGEKGWIPIGNSSANDFRGKFDGNNHVIKNLMINRPDESYVGLFGFATYGYIENLGMTGGSITGYQAVGGIAGLNKDGKIANCYNTGSVNGSKYVGGVVGQNLNPTEGMGVVNCYNNGNVTGSEHVGGVVGYANNKSSIENCYNTGSINGNTEVGGVVGKNENDAQNCYNTGSVSGKNNVGGVAGENSGTISKCYSVGGITGENRVGGIVGFLSGGKVDGCYYNSDKCDEAAIGVIQSGTAGSIDVRKTSEMTASDTLSMGLCYLGDAWKKRQNTGSESYYPELKVFIDSTNTVITAASKLSVTVRGGGSDPDTDPGTPGETVTVPSDTTGITINLTAETIELGSFTVAAYSINGGVKWIKGSLPTDAVKFSRLFDKELTLWLSDTYNERDVKEEGVVVEKKGVPDNANIVKFPKINTRPKANSEKLAAHYADSTWTLMTKQTKTAAATAPQSVYEYVKGNTTDGKLPDDPTWLMSPESGFSIKSKPSKDDKSKNVYYFRSVASASGDTYTPGSKAFKISPAYYGTAYKYKINYKTELLKLKKGDMYSVDSGTDWTEVTDQKGILLNISYYITSGTNIMVKKAATGTKPRTDIQTIAPVGRMVMEDKTFACANGKITDTAELKKYEILSKDSKGNVKWGNLPKVAENKEFEIRLKSDAKFSKDTWTGNAASAAGKLTITYDVYDESGKTPKSGIIKAYISMDSDSDEP